jgi:multicomponent Na+:H+ antiporter subunit G
MSIADAFTVVAVFLGVVFFLAGTLGLIRFPDTLSRLHALSKADNVGLGLIALGLMPQATSLFAASKLVVVWLLAQLSAATASQLIARAAARGERDS